MGKKNAARKDEIKRKGRKAEGDAAGVGSGKPRRGGA